MIELLEQCVRIPSLSRQEAQVAAFLRDEMKQRGFDRAFIDDAGNAVGIIGNGPKQIVMLGHMDTVGGDVPVRYEDGNLYGRGSVDAKGPLCAFILAAQHFVDASRITHHASNVKRVASNNDWQLIVIGATEEEAASSKGARFAATQYAPAFCIIGEPSGMDGITLGYKGRLLAHARFEQAMQHTAMPGPSVSEQAVALWNHVKKLSDEFNAGKPKTFDQIMPSLRHIQSGSDGLKEWCDLTIAARLPEDFGPERLEQEISDWRVEIADLGLRIADGTSSIHNPQSQIRNQPTLSYSGAEHAYRSSKDSPLAWAFVDGIRTEKMRPAFKLKTGTADFNVVGPVWNCPIVAYGPGDSSLDHTPIEHVSIDEFEKAVKVLTHVLTTLMKQ
jgi:LysW-gamma-L-lysine carboxypeptidase